MSDDQTPSPGPWRHRRGLVFDENDVAVCEFAREANARLIAAAPVMREALQVLLDATKSIYPEEGAAKALAMLAAVGITLDG